MEEQSGQWSRRRLLKAGVGAPIVFRSKSIATLLGSTVSLLALGCLTRPSPQFNALPKLARRSGVPLVSVISPSADPVVPLIETLRSELWPDFDLDVIRLDEVKDSEALAKKLNAAQPSLVVLVDNSSVERYAPIARAAQDPWPSVIVMSSFVEHLVRWVPGAHAIAFETPVVTIFARLRDLFSSRFASVGVLYRKGFEGFIELERKRAALEQIRMVDIEVSQQPSLAELKSALLQLESRRVDTVWIPNDNRLLTPDFLERAWVPFSERIDIPIVVGVPSLVGDPLNLGTFAAVPDITGLGVQTADLIYALEESEHKLRTPLVQPPISTKTYLDLPRAERVGLSERAESRVDVLVDP